MGILNKKQDEIKTQLKPVYVVYVGVGAADEEGQKRIIKAAYDALFEVLGDEDANTIFLPTRDLGTRIECINPTYVTEDEVIRKHRLLMDELHEHLENQILN